MSELVPITEIIPDPKQPRRIFDEERLVGLMDSLAQEGMINPIEIDEQNKILTGERRYRAAKKLGWTEVPVNRNSKKYSWYDRLRHQMAENLHQSVGQDAMNPVDTANALMRLLQHKGYKKEEKASETKVQELAVELGVKTRFIYEHIRLYFQPQYVKQALLQGVPKTSFLEVDRIKGKENDVLKRKVAKGEYTSKSEIRKAIQILHQLPELKDMLLQREQAKASKGANRILDAIVRLGLALKETPLEEIHRQEKKIIISQLVWIHDKITTYKYKGGE